MRDLRSRIESLEARAGAGRDAITVVIRRIVDPARPMEPATVIRSYGSGDSWMIRREPGESLDDFEQRAFDTAPRVGGVARLLEK